MNWNIFEYAGHTAWAWTSLLISLVVLLSVLAASGFLLWRRKWIWGAFPLPLLVAWGVCWGILGPKLDHASPPGNDRSRSGKAAAQTKPFAIS